MAKQSAIDQARRMEKGCCPVHGIPMPQLGLAGNGDLKELFLVECPRHDCDIRGTTTEPFGQVTLIGKYPQVK